MKFLHLAPLTMLTALCMSDLARSDPLEQCIQGVTIEGSFMAGRIFKGNVFIPHGNQQEQLKKVAKTLVKEGLTLNTMDKDLGLLTASYSKRAVGSQAPSTTTFSLIFDQKKDGLEARATLSTPGGITTNESTNKKDLCSLLLLE